MTELTYQEFMENIESHGYEIDMSEEEFDNLSEEELAELTGHHTHMSQKHNAQLGRAMDIDKKIRVKMSKEEVELVNEDNSRVRHWVVNSSTGESDGNHQDLNSAKLHAQIQIGGKGGPWPHHIVTTDRSYDGTITRHNISREHHYVGQGKWKTKNIRPDKKIINFSSGQTPHVHNIKEEVELDEGTQAADSLHPNTKSAGSDPKSRIEMMVSVLQGIDAMPKRDFVKWFDAQQAVFGPGKDYGVGDNSASNQSTIDMKNGSSPKTRDAMPKLSVKEDVEEMFSGSDLSEEFKDKASTLFEAAVSARIIAETVRLEEEFETRFDEAVEEITGELSSKVDSYLDYVVEQWLEDNEVAIESTLRNEIMEEFIDGMKNLFAEHYIDVPEEKVSVIESLASKVEALESKLNEQILENTEIKRSLLDAEKTSVFEDYADDLTLSQQEKFKALAEGVNFDGDLEVYAKKLNIIKETYFVSDKKVTTSTNLEEETFEGETSPNVVSVDPSVNRYVQAISRTLKK